MIASMVPGLASIQDQVNRGTLLKVDPFRIAIITPSSGVQFYKNGIVFLSNTRNEDKMVQNQISFGRADAYYEAFKDTIKGTRTPFSRSALFEVPVDGMTFSSDFNTMYFTKRVSRNEPEKIFRARYQAAKGGRDWVQDSKPLSFCNDGADYSHPSLSSGGEMMVFASDRGDTGGDFDIFITRFEGTTWTDPVNTGKEINTAGNELSPFLDQNNNLYFSSDGHKGLGGYDIFFCKFNGTGWDKPVNLTDRINTGNDEFAFTLDRIDGQTAFFTRRANSGKSPLKLFRVTFQDKTAVNKLTNLSNAFEYLAIGTLPGVISETPASASTARVDVAKAVSEQNPVKKEMPTEKKPVASAKTGQLKSQSDLPPVQKPAGVKKETPVPQPASKVNEVIYRVQFATYSKPKGSYEITVGGVKYNTFEYLYNGSYRACAGEFTTKIQASALQKVFKQAGYADAFVAAFKNNVRSLDPALFK